MKIQIDGTNRLNKGAELMLFAILDQIENKHPDATVLFNDRHSGMDFTKVPTPLAFHKPLRLRFGHYPWGLLSRLHLPYRYFTEFYPMNSVDLILDASGFRLGDQWNHSDRYLDDMAGYYKALKSRGSKLYFLPQAFGPFETDSGRRSAEILNSYADLIIAREAVSRNHLLKAGVSPGKIMQYPDFTLTAKGSFPDSFAMTRGAVCIIPNRKMFSHTRLDFETYLDFLSAFISRIEKSGKQVYLLNHEGDRELKLCRRIQKAFHNRIPLIQGLNAREIKGMIREAYLVISSRYHGVASALSQGVPCLATSWSHKYQLLFQDFSLEDQVIDPERDPQSQLFKLDLLLEPNHNHSIRVHLQKKTAELARHIELMWQTIWNAFEN